VVWQDDLAGEQQLQSPRIESRLPLEEAPRHLNSRYTFETFVVGPAIDWPCSGAGRGGEPGARLQPALPLWRVGLGKTHLLHAMGNACRMRGLQVLYVSSEEFTNDLINAIRSTPPRASASATGRSDVLLIDDIQFIAGKEATRKSSSTPSTPCTSRRSSWSSPPIGRQRRWLRWRSGCALGSSGG